MANEVGILYILSNFKYIELINDTQTNLGHFWQDDIVAPDDIDDLEEEDGGNVDEDIAEGGGIDMPDTNR